MLYRPDFNELFLTTSLSRPRLLLAIEQTGLWRFFSLLQPQNPCEKSSSLVVAADFHTKFPGNNMRICCSSCRQFSYGYASGLIYFSGVWISETSEVPVVCNPNTGRRYGSLPKLARYRKSYGSFLVFDPIDKEYKVLFMAYPYCSEGGDHRILTLGTGKMRWRKIQCSLTHEPLSVGICIDGVLYYLAEAIDETPYEIVCFDVKSEKFTFIRFIDSDDWCARLINYKDKLGVINWKYEYTNDAIELRTSILEDVEKQEWSKHVYTFIDHVEDVNVNDAWVLKSSIYGSYVKNKRSLVSSEVAEDSSDSDKERDTMNLMTPSGKRIYRDRPVKPPAKAKEMIWQVTNGGRGNRGRGNRDGRG